MHGNFAGAQSDSRRQIRKFLIYYPYGRLNERLGALRPGLVEVRENPCEPFSTPTLIIDGFSRGKPPEMGNQLFAVGHAVCPYLLMHTGLEDLLGPAAPDPEHTFQRRA